MRKRSILAAALALGVLCRRRPPLGYRNRLGCFSSPASRTNYYQCLMNCPYKYTDPAACEYICQAEVCEAP